MVTFIYEHFDEEISVTDIATNGNVFAYLRRFLTPHHSPTTVVSMVTSARTLMWKMVSFPLITAAEMVGFLMFPPFR